MSNMGELVRSAKGLELIQQWQYLGKPPIKLLENEAFEYAKEAGLTSVQSYVTWASIEKEPGRIDFSSYDVLVEKLAKHKLRWVPFLILGPNYATPKWFQKSKESVYARCLEHGKETRIQSIWNPYLPKWVDRFIELVAGHYRDCGILESIELGISGNWGEALYPVSGGFYQGFHTHPGWWCGDGYATSDFHCFALERYKSLQGLNSAWGTGFVSPAEISFPQSKSLGWVDVVHRIFTVVPYRPKSFVALIGRLAKPLLGKRQRFIQQKDDFGEQQRWLDFVEWYLSSMTCWAEFWLKSARKYFPDIEIYLATGGDGKPILGADFSAQTKIAAKYDAGIRITNQTDEYSESCVLTRLVSSGARFYNTYFTTEEAGINSPSGVTMRVFDAATSGAKGAYFKSIIGIGKDLCTGRNFALGEPTQGATNLARNLHYFTLSKPIIEVAVLVPNTSIAFDFHILTSIYHQCSELRDLIDFDLIDENMITDGVLGRSRFLVVIDGKEVRPDTLIEIIKWVNDGGVFIMPRYAKLYSFGESVEIYDQLCVKSEKEVIKVGKGYVFFYNGNKGRDYLEFISLAVHNEKGYYPWEGIPKVDGFWDKVYATRFADRIMYYNSADSTILVQFLPKDAPILIRNEGR